jgi:hypothetical protein
MTRPGRSSGDLLVDPLGRFLLGTEENGGIIALDADTLDPVWGWAALGATSTAIAMTRSGHRVYQAVDRSGDADSPQLLVRDAQTGRVLRSVRVPIAAASIVVGDADEAYLAGRSETGVTSVVSLVWRDGEMEVAWRRGLERLEVGEGSIPRLFISPSARRLLVAAADGLSGLYLLDSATGAILGRLRDAGRDVAFAPDDGVLLLLSGEIQRLEGDQ